jgi:hypothetical protein
VQGDAIMRHSCRAHFKNLFTKTLLITNSFLFFMPTVAMICLRPIQQTNTTQQLDAESIAYLLKQASNPDNVLQELYSSVPDSTLTKKLWQATHAFRHKPGFPSMLYNTIREAHSPDTARGYLFELETALAAQADGEIIVAFGQHHSDSLGRDREIDIETEKLWIECKDICWHRLKLHEKQKKLLEKQKQKLIRQLTDEQSLMEEMNGKTKNQKTFVLCSKQPISQEWQEWLEEQAIAFIQQED